MMNSYLSPSPEFEDEFVCLYMTHLISSIRKLKGILEVPVKENEKLLHYLFKAFDVLDNFFKKKKDLKSRGLFEQFSKQVIEAEDLALIPNEVLDKLDANIISYLTPRLSK